MECTVYAIYNTCTIYTMPSSASPSLDISALRRDKSSPFTTPSDVLHALNTALQELPAASTSSSSCNKNNNGQFELQRRLPDGSARVATERESKAADMESKLNQVLHHIRNMSTEEQLTWAEDQRQYGNHLYAQQQYEQAMDVYLTLLPVAYQQHSKLLLARVMNNLAQSSLQLSWYQKTITFANMALERLLTEQERESNDSRDDNDDEDYSVLIAKLYYKRGKAYRLTGEYSLAQTDLRQAQEWIRRLDENQQQQAVAEITQTADEPNRKSTFSLLLATVNQERQRLAKAAAEGKRNKERAQRAMQSVFAGDSCHKDEDSKSSLPHTTTNEVSPNASRAQVHHHDTGRSLYNTVEMTQSRQYSTLRAPTKMSTKQDQHGDDSEDYHHNVQTLSYVQWYLAMVGRIAERILILVGDEEWVQEHKHGRKEE